MSEPRRATEDDLGEEERKENVKLVSDFFLILLGIILGYFGAAAAASPNALGISVLIDSIVGEIVHFPAFPTLGQVDVVARAVGFLVLMPVSVIMYPLMLMRYTRWLKQQSRISLVREFTELFFLLFWPIPALWIINPPPFLDPTGQLVQRFIGLFYVIINISYFLYKTRSARRGYFQFSIGPSKKQPHFKS